MSGTKTKYFLTDVFYAIKDLFLLIKKNKYSFLRSVVLFLTITVVYHLFTDASYTVSATLAIPAETQFARNLGSASAPTAIEFTSQTAIKRAVESQGLHVRYFTKNVLRQKEVYGADVPVIVKLVEQHQKQAVPNLEVEITDTATFVLHENGQAHTYRFGEVIRRLYATFVVSPNQGSNRAQQKVMVLWQDADVVAAAYAAKLRFGPVPEKPTEYKVAITDAFWQRGVDFLYALVKAGATAQVQHQNAEKLTAAFLSSKLDSLKQELAQLETLEQQAKHTEQPAAPVARVKSQQQKAIEAIEPYVHKPVHLFTLIPDNFELGNQHLQRLVLQYNQTQISKQALLQHFKQEDQLVQDADQELRELQQTMISEIEGMQVVSKSDSAAGNLASVQDKRLVKKTEYRYFLQRKNELKTAPEAATEPPAFKQKPEEHITSDNHYSCYLLAFVLGMAMPVFLIRVLHW
ncbi:hypothetical protein FVR03_21490 [Pontibacter qinzhouensis]|uniref:Polysaccharide chain length determinant N-terminal domain-containing protein n=1 Tax=Pontibacter qinzhouensis TaxID=2603253 RepID=A0A5C8J029_9BACT|nr:hypothetical protein [Pontibacter qinzhouensis]TXK26763.1 hypothetical protein FVR03_21490 [Pontibacter qinzhouensis]